jgi:hypothetical protein
MANCLAGTPCDRTFNTESVDKSTVTSAMAGRRRLRRGAHSKVWYGDDAVAEGGGGADAAGGGGGGSALSTATGGGAG